jgi:hypothetical protein
MQKKRQPRPEPSGRGFSVFGNAVRHPAGSVPAHPCSGECNYLRSLALPHHPLLSSKGHGILPKDSAASCGGTRLASVQSSRIALIGHKLEQFNLRLFE